MVSPHRPDRTRVVVDQVQDAVAAVPVPTTEVQQVGQAIGTFLVWPRHLVMTPLLRAKAYNDRGKQVVRPPAIPAEEAMPEVEDDAISRLLSILPRLRRQPVQILMGHRVFGVDRRCPIVHFIARRFGDCWGQHDVEYINHPVVGYVRFISIDCGAPAGVNYTESTTSIIYISDANFINTGVSQSVVSELKSVYQQQMWTLRSFPEGKRNCFKINITRGSRYLIRAGFLYGNYDGLNKLPDFDLHLGPNRWDTVTINNASNDEHYEIIHVPSLDYIQLCLADTGNGTPFISDIEIRTLKNETYVAQFGSALQLYKRCDLGTNKTVTAYRYKYDVYDRFWYTCDFKQNWTSVQNASIATASFGRNRYQLPAIVMSTAVIPTNASAPLVISWKPEHENDQFHAYLHFTEIQVLAANQTRQFNITTGDLAPIANFSPQYLNVTTAFTNLPIRGKEINYSLEITKNSTLPPIINAIEIYKVIDFQQLNTFQGDVDAITTIKSVYELTKDWEGDPCAPVAYLWDGLNCSYPPNDFPRITTLNLSSSGLSGKIDPSISKLTMLEKLNLENNNLSGSIPSALLEKSKKGSLSLSYGKNPYLCQSGECDAKDSKKNIVAPLVASISGVLVLLGAVAILWTLKKRRKSKALTEARQQIQMSPHYTDQDDSLLQFKKQIYSYSDVLKITNNFDTIVGKGGFGRVYMGYIDDTPVAVKMLSPSAVHGYQQFQAEVKLLIRVHHKNLTSLIGYCNEETNKGLIYEYMANGNLQEHLSGLEYLQNGCKPPIFHRDIKSTNILLNEHFEAKLSDFGLSKSIPTEGGSHVSTVVAGTPGYLDPEYYITNRLTDKSDIYSFGVVLMEIITSKPVIAKNQENTHISQWVSSLMARGDINAIVDSRLDGEFDSNSVWKVVEIATACVSPNPNRRPIISVIVSELKESLAMELARTEHSNTDTSDSIKLTMNLNTEFFPLSSLDLNVLPPTPHPPPLVHLRHHPHLSRAPRHAVLRNPLRRLQRRQRATRSAGAASRARSVRREVNSDARAVELLDDLRSGAVGNGEFWSGRGGNGEFWDRGGGVRFPKRM
ncbi:hypothetical protein Fmac_019891 [Flemingia macrophylla]|uniref:Protein kinase domain-containing protein n=1 Tax=Flemingia macrophylla TaxID=520843 RepID=A0ABD1M936_9FABA